MSSHESFEQDDDKGRGMYKIGKESFNKHKMALKRHEKYTLVRQESLHGLKFENAESEVHRNVANRVFNNHDIASARASHASEIAEAKIKSHDDYI